jgi:hypothetical protein
VLFLVALTIASAAPCPDKGMHHCLIEAAALASVQKDNLEVRVVSDMKAKGVDPKDFRDAQEAFSSFRDAECAAHAGTDRRTYIQTEAGLRCWTRLTKERSVTIWRDWMGQSGSPPER